MTPQELKKLKIKAHSLNPVVMIGQRGLTENVLNEIEIALVAHELIKIKIAAEKSEQQEMVDEICSKTNAIHVQSIGRVSIIYRENQD